MLPAPLLLKGKNVKDRVVRINCAGDEVRSERLPHDDLERLTLPPRTLAEEVVLAVRDDHLNKRHILRTMDGDTLLPSSGWAKLERCSGAAIGEHKLGGNRTQESAEGERRPHVSGSVLTHSKLYACHVPYPSS